MIIDDRRLDSTDLFGFNVQTSSVSDVISSWGPIGASTTFQQQQQQNELQSKTSKTSLVKQVTKFFIFIFYTS
jgi:hypothetical protein